MKKIVSMASCLLIAICVGCTSSYVNKNHIGTWEVDLSNEDHLGEMDKLIWVIDETTLSFNLDGKAETNSYSIDYTKTPIWFDSVIDGHNVRCILEFLDEDTFRITGVNDDRDPRLTTFEGADDIVIFKRVK